MTRRGSSITPPRAESHTDVKPGIASGRTWRGCCSTATGRITGGRNTGSEAAASWPAAAPGPDRLRGLALGRPPRRWLPPAPPAAIATRRPGQRGGGQRRQIRRPGVYVGATQGHAAIEQDDGRSKCGCSDRPDHVSQSAAAPASAQLQIRLLDRFQGIRRRNFRGSGA